MNQSIVQINIPGDRVLRDVSVEVPEHIFNTPELEEILLRMKEALESEKDGVALAAPQIGISYRIFIVRYDRLMTPPEKPEESEVRVQPDIGVFINPEFVNISRMKDVSPFAEYMEKHIGIYVQRCRHKIFWETTLSEEGAVYFRKYFSMRQIILMVFSLLIMRLNFMSRGLKILRLQKFLPKTFHNFYG
jgi:Polypeptide deformylase